MTGFIRFALRDSILLSGTILLWVSLGGLSADSGLLADFLGASLGVAAGLCAWQTHEWGHWLAAKMVGASLRQPAKLMSVYLFGFDKEKNSQAQFLLMALGGFAATAIVFLFILPLLPADWMATRVLRGLVLLEIAVTAVLEVPGFLLGLVAYDKLPSVDVLEGTSSTTIDD